MEKCNYISLADVDAEPIRRYDSGIDEMNWLWGVSEFKRRGTFSWGAPKGKITLIAGAGGIGKSRGAIAMAKSMAAPKLRLHRKAKPSYKVLYFQNEVDDSTFAGWANQGGAVPRSFHVSSASNLEGQMRAIRSLRPHFVFVDSINMVEEFATGSKKKITNLVQRYQEVCRVVGCHVIFLCQLNVDGSVKGGSTLTHLVDIVFKALPYGIDGYFGIAVGSKHRYGPTGEQRYSVWRHTADGAICDSAHRIEDGRWCKLYRCKRRDPIAELKRAMESQDIRDKAEMAAVVKGLQKKGISVAC
ncbi:AAA family ATPase [Candidatus Pacearchaeota archaeon]|nr:AAA family ATPase [Candidatus Pacearchaeota archaeon]